MECRRKRGGRTGDQHHGNPRNSSSSAKRLDPRGCAELPTPTGDRHHAVLHVGLPDVPKRHSGTAPQIHLRFDLCTRDARAIGILLGVLLILSALGEIR